MVLLASMSGTEWIFQSLFGWTLAEYCIALIPLRLLANFSSSWCPAKVSGARVFRGFKDNMTAQHVRKRSPFVPST